MPASPLPPSRPTPPAPPSKPAPPTTRPAPPDLTKIPTVKAIQIQFQTNDDDKDQDTRLIVDFIHDGQVFASARPTNDDVSMSFGSEVDDFSDGQTTGWLSVPVLSAIRKDQVPLSTTNVHIDPIGNDTWRFDYWVQLHYSDGTMTELHFNGHALSEKVRDNSFPLK